MATLTGFKRVRGDNSKKASGDAAQPNPTFVFDEVDVNNGRDPEADSDTQDNQEINGTVHEPENSSQQQQQQQQNTRTMNHNATPEVKETLSENSDKSQQPIAAPRTPPSEKRKMESKSQNLNPTTTTSGDNISVSMLAVDCTGKSPRTPRRSPLMALFKGKPRESVRRLYTEEDQFEIEWADLSMQLQKKWYQRIQPWIPGNSSADSMTDSDAPKKILKNVDGRIKSGEITAVLGPSGAGKTSLLNGLFGKYRTSVQGYIKVRGAPSRKNLTVCTIPQSDYLIGYLSTQESLFYASRLKNCEDDFDHDRNIERVIELLGLQSCRHTRINKLSGGQYKRVSIAQEMLSSPDILVLDEPTSGLDSLTCYRTVKVLRDLVEASKAHNLVNPMSIILTIHQPHREVLELFHSVYVMAVGGLTLYQGPPSEMEERINKYSGTNMPAEGYNPASFMVELASEEYGRQPIENLVRHQREKFKSSTRNKYIFQEPHPIDLNSNQQQKTNNSINATNWYKGDLSDGKSKIKSDSSITLYPLDSGKNDNQSGNNINNSFVDINLDSSNIGSNAKMASLMGNNNSGDHIRDIDSRIMTPRSGKNSNGVFWRHVNLMARRCLLANTRDPLLFTMRLLAHIFIPIVVALIYGPKMGIPNGCPFYMPEINLLEYATVGVEEIREKHDAIRIQFQNVGLHFMVYYAFGLCMLAFTAISFPLIMHVLIKEIRNGWYSLSTFIVGQPASTYHWRYFVQSLILILLIMIAEAKGLVFGAVCMNSMQTAVFAASVSTVPFILLSGFLIRIHEIPHVLQGVAEFSYFKHSVEALIITRYGFGMCPCDPARIPPGGTPRIIGVPPQIMSLTDYYLVPSSAPASDNEAETTTTRPLTTTMITDIHIPGNNQSLARIARAINQLPSDLPLIRETRAAARKPGRKTTTTTTTTTEATTTELETTEPPTEPPKKQGVFFDKLATLMTRANAFGFSIESCADVEPFTMKDMGLTDDQLPWLIGYLFLSIVVLKVMSYFIVDFCLKLKL